MPIEAVDTHTHVVSADTERYPITPGLGGEHDWHRERPVDAAGMIARADAAGVGGVAFVQALSCHGFDNRYVLDSARLHPGRAVAIVALRADDREAPSLLGRAVAEGAAGVRVTVPSHSGAQFDDADVRRLADAAGAHAIPVVLIGLAPHIPSIGVLASAVPRTTVVVDHCAFADASAHGSDGARSLLALADVPNVVLKVSTINLRATPDPAALWSILVAAFGAGRLMWGSDHPHTDGPGYGPLVELARRSTAGLGDEDRREVLAGTAQRLWPTLGAPT